LEVDYTTDVEAVRRKLKEVMAAAPPGMWDGGVAHLQVTDSADRTMRIRALVSAMGPEKLWDLRCVVREQLVAFLVEHPDWLPRTRASAPVGTPRAAVETAAAAPSERR
jgi:hypothetical protein